MLLMKLLRQFGKCSKQRWPEPSPVLCRISENGCFETECEGGRQLIMI